MKFNKDNIIKFLISYNATREAKYQPDEIIYNKLVTNLLRLITFYHLYKIHLTVYIENGGTPGEDYVQFLILYILYSFVGDNTIITNSLYQDVFKKTYALLGLRDISDAYELEEAIGIAESLTMLWEKKFPHLF